MRPACDCVCIIDDDGRGRSGGGRDVRLYSVGRPRRPLTWSRHSAKSFPAKEWTIKPSGAAADGVTNMPVFERVTGPRRGDGVAMHVAAKGAGERTKIIQKSNSLGNRLRSRHQDSYKGASVRDCQDCKRINSTGLEARRSGPEPRLRKRD